MLTEERYAAILKILDEKKAVTVPVLTKLLGASESTIRRDLTALSQCGKLYKVYGGATAIESSYNTVEEDIVQKKGLHISDKAAIAKAAAKLIKPGDFIYIDAGTTTDHLIDYITETNATYITNGINHAGKLAARGFNACVLSGRIKASTGAAAGAQTLLSLRHYNFTKGFFGANGISIHSGFTTPEPNEGLVKAEAVSRSKKVYILADPSKFNRIAPITFANISAATIITTSLTDRKYLEYTTITEVSKHDLHSNI